MRVDLLKCSWKESRSFWGTKRAAVEAILRGICVKDRLAVVVGLYMRQR